MSSSLSVFSVFRCTSSPSPFQEQRQTSVRGEEEEEEGSESDIERLRESVHMYMAPLCPALAHVLVCVPRLVLNF